MIASVQKNKDSIRKSMPIFDRVSSDIEVLSLKGSGLNYSFSDLIEKVGF